VHGLVATDLGGRKVDPYCIFFTNPAGLLGADPPVSAVKRGFTDVHGKTAAKKKRPVLTRRSSTDAYHEPSRWLRARGRSTWKDSEIPLFRPRIDAADLKFVTLIIALFDHDFFSEDDPLGIVEVPLARRPEPEIPVNDEVTERRPRIVNFWITGRDTAQTTESDQVGLEATGDRIVRGVADGVRGAVDGVAALTGAVMRPFLGTGLRTTRTSSRQPGTTAAHSDEYSFVVDEPIVFENTVNRSGRLKCRVTVSSGRDVHSAMIRRSSTHRRHVLVYTRPLYCHPLCAGAPQGG
jgi:hypothetical protein